MSKFKVVTPKGASFSVAGSGYAYEKEALDPIGAEIVEAPANEAEFIAAARTADAIYAKGMPISKKIIDALENCKVITLGTVGGPGGFDEFRLIGRRLDDLGADRIERLLFKGITAAGDRKARAFRRHNPEL